MDARLRVLTGPLSGQTITVQHGKLLIGREEDCLVRLESEFVSRHHCALLLDEYTLRVLDLGSRNGTFVNGRRIGSCQTILLHDDTVSVDTTTIRIDLSSGDEPAAAMQRSKSDPSSSTPVRDDDTVHASDDTSVADIRTLRPMADSYNARPISAQ